MGKRKEYTYESLSDIISGGVTAPFKNKIISSNEVRVDLEMDASEFRGRPTNQNFNRKKPK